MAVEIDVSKISKAEGRLIGLRFKGLLEKFYSNPENERKFQEWYAKRQQKENEEQQNKGDNYATRRKKTKKLNLANAVQTAAI